MVIIADPIVLGGNRVIWNLIFAVFPAIDARLLWPIWVGLASSIRNQLGKVDSVHLAVVEFARSIFRNRKIKSVMRRIKELFKVKKKL